MFTLFGCFSLRLFFGFVFGLGTWVCVFEGLGGIVFEFCGWLGGVCGMGVCGLLVVGFCC